MASLNTSEVQFTAIFFAKFNELHHYGFQHVILPNPRQEGNEGNPERGTDIVLDEYFLQVKMSEQMVGRNAGHALEVGTPYFKFRVYNNPRNRQFGQLDFLKAFTRNVDNKVYYVAPCFNSANYHRDDTSDEFWCDYFYRCEPANLWDFVTLIDIGSIQDAWIEPNDNHEICYRHDGDAYFFSEQKVIKRIKPIIESEEQLISRVTKDNKTVEQIIKQRIDDITTFSKSPFTRMSRLEPSDVDLFELQKIFLSVFSTIWIPIIIPKNKISG